MTWNKTSATDLLKEIQDPHLLTYATEAERGHLEAMVTHGSARAAARALKVHHTAVLRSLQRVRARAIKQGYAPGFDWTKPVPEPHTVKGVSTLYDADGKVRAQWVKSRNGAGVEDAKVAVLDWIAGSANEAVAPARVPGGQVLEALTVYPVGDHHLGMFAWAKETGDSDHDLARGERILIDTAHTLMSRTPNTTEAVVASVGDFYHADTKSNQTLGSGHPLDVDTRWGKVLQTGFRLFRTLIDGALRKHQKVRVVIVPGNHDDHSSLVLTLFLASWYRNEPRLTIDTERASAMRQYVHFGKVLICFDHGDKSTPERIAGLIPTEQRAVWSAIRHCHVFRGHIHHDRVRDFPGVKVEHLRVLAPADAWHAGKGFVGIGRDMKAIVFDPQAGEIERLTQPLVEAQP